MNLTQNLLELLILEICKFSFWLNVKSLTSNMLFTGYLLGTLWDGFIFIPSAVHGVARGKKIYLKKMIFVEDTNFKFGLAYVTPRETYGIPQ